MTVEEFYGQVGSYAEATGRLGSAERILHYLGKFRRDGNYDGLCRAMADGDAKTAFLCVHNLKGMYLNLALTQVGEKASTLCEALRGGSIPPEAPEMLAELQQAYAQVMTGLDALLGEQEVAP